MTTDLKITYTNKAYLDAEDYCVVVFTNLSRSNNRLSAVAWQVIKKIARNGSHHFDYPARTSVQATWDGGRSGTARRAVHHASFALEETESGFSLVDDQSEATPRQFSLINKAAIPSGITAIAFKADKPIMIVPHVGKGQRASFVLDTKLYWAVVPNTVAVGEVIDLDNVEYQEVAIQARQELSVTLRGNLEDGYRFKFSSEGSDGFSGEGSDDSSEIDDSDTIDESEYEPESPDSLDNIQSLENEGYSHVIAQKLARAIAPSPTQLFVEDTRHQDLFPFVYMRPWPQIRRADKARFVEYDSKMAAADSLYQQLMSLRSEPNGRSQMQQAAVAFINAPDFIGSLANLPGPLRNFAQLGTWLEKRPTITWRELRSHIQSFGSSWQEMIDYLRSQTYQQQKDRLWQTFFAFMIVLGDRLHLLERIIQTLVIANLLETLISSDTEAAKTAKQPQHTVRTYAQATIVLPKTIFPLPPAQPPASSSTGEALAPLTHAVERASEWVKPYAIGDLNVVRQRLLRYEVGEISHIENVLRGERKQATKRTLNQVTSSVAQTHDRLEGNQRSTQADLLNEVQKTLSQNKLTADFDNFNTSYGPPTTVKYDGTWSMGNQADPAQADMTKFAKDVTAQTANRIARQVHEVRSLTNLDEREETVVHSFDNRDRTENVRGIYRWINKIYSAHVVNDGHRLIIEFMVDSPAADYIQRESKLRGLALTRPLSLEEKGILSHQDITRENYLKLAASYQVKDIAPPLSDSSVVSAVFESKSATHGQAVAIPDGYEAARATLTYLLSGESAQKLIGLIGKNRFEVPASVSSPIFTEPSSEGSLQEDDPQGGSLQEDGPQEDGSQEDSPQEDAPQENSPQEETLLDEAVAVDDVSDTPSNNPSENVSGNIRTGSQHFSMNQEDSVVSVAIAVEPENLLLPLSPPITAGTYFATVEIECELAPEVFQKWQIETYNVLLAGYQTAADHYYQQADSQPAGLSHQNPLINRQVEKTELKKTCVKQLLKQHFKRVGMPSDASEESDPSLFAVNQPRYIQFFETAFDWGEMTAHFYPKLQGTLQEETPLDVLTETAVNQMTTDDLAFTNFLQAGLARVLLPVRADYTEIVLYYLSSGMIWPGANTLVPVNDSEISLINEWKDLALKEKSHKQLHKQSHPHYPEAARSESWEITIPTSMLIVQDSSELPHFGHSQTS